MAGTPKAAGSPNGGAKPTGRGKLKDSRVAATRELILSTAERLFAEHGVVAVSNRQISEEAGLGNNAAVGYHFGAKTDLVRSVVRRRTDEMERLRSRMVAEVGDSDHARDWVAGMVRPYVWHLAELGSPTWFGRFGAQVLTDPAYREIMVVESLHASSLIRVMEGLNRCLPEMPGDVRLQRQDMSRQLLVHAVAERERALAAGEWTPQESWDEAATGLIDAITGMWFAPVTGRAGSADSERSRIEGGEQTMKVTVDQEKCCSAGTCAMLAPEVFDQRDEDGVVVLLNSEPPADQQDDARQAAEMCPARAIELSERE